MYKLLVAILSLLAAASSVSSASATIEISVGMSTGTDSASYSQTFDGNVWGESHAEMSPNAGIQWNQNFNWGPGGQLSGSSTLNGEAVGWVIDDQVPWSDSEGNSEWGNGVGHGSIDNWGNTWANFMGLDINAFNTRHVEITASTVFGT